MHSVLPPATPLSQVRRGQWVYPGHTGDLSGPSRSLLPLGPLRQSLQQRTQPRPQSYRQDCAKGKQTSRWEEGYSPGLGTQESPRGKAYSIRESTPWHWEDSPGIQWKQEQAHSYVGQYLFKSFSRAWLVTAV